ncbi:MAG: E3 binding domain-containing protein, partial [Verrucomicrobia bacterium]|nr:E3 binding domain-containing protein [Verrucomicrobiota bacterium]
MSNLHSNSSRRPGRVVASPRARRTMRQFQVDPNSVRGSGPGGRIVEADVKAVGAPPAATQGAARSGMKSAAGKTPKPAAAPRTGAGISVMRRAIAEKTALSFSTVPHFYLRTEVDATPLIEFRQQLVSV